MNQRFTRFYLICIAILLFLPLIQQIFRPFKLAGLQGAFDPGAFPVCNAASWFLGKFQPATDHYIKYNTAFNGELVRFRNQVDYSLFGNINTNLTLGKENYLFDPNYIYALEGTDLISDSLIQAKNEAIGKTIELLREMEVPLVVCIAPNKAGFYESYLPEPLHRGMVTNRTLFDSLLNLYQVPVIDFDKWFLSIKNDSPYLLIPKYGAHWSTYGAALASDSLMSQLASVLQKKLVPFSIHKTETSDKARFSDDDYLASLNLMKKWPSPPMAYPQLEFGDGMKPNVLIISDSFIWNLYDLGIMQNCFKSNSHTAYYFKTLFDSKKNNLGPLPELKKEHLADRDIIILLTSDPGLKEFGYGFFEAVSRMNIHE